MILFGFCVYYLFSAKQSVSNCNTPLYKWLFVQAVIYISAVIRNVLIMSAINFENGKKHKEIIDMIYATTFMNFQVAWLIYGNTFHYSKESLFCKNIDGNVWGLWTLMMVILA